MMIYVAPEAREAYIAAGLEGYWMGYVAARRRDGRRIGRESGFSDLSKSLL